ncbi:MAG TPA: hypothetical protein VH834_25260 [Solirubrobacteraceae bacterium]
MTDELRLEELGVAVLVYGQSNGHVELIEDLRAAGLEDEHLIVVHNPDRPTDGWRPVSPDGATVIALERNVGYAAGMNRAIDAFAARGLNAVLLLTHDVRVQRTTLRALVAAANAAPGYGVLGLAVRGAGGVETSYGSFLRGDGIVEHVTRRPDGEGVADSMFVDGSAMFVRVNACGPSPLPERYFMYFEEAELCSNVRRRGWGVGTALDAAATSVSGIRHRRAAFQYLYVRNGLDWAWRHQGRGAALRYLAHELRRAAVDVPKPGGRRFRDSQQRRAGYEALLARLLGVGDFLRRRWGPPPELLLRASDVRNV